jgi:excisionase family DNA binding protein
MDEVLLTSDEVAKLLKTTPRFVRRLVQERRIEHVKVGRCVRFTRQAVEEYMRRNTFEVLTRAELMRRLAGV